VTLGLCVSTHHVGLGGEPEVVVTDVAVVLDVLVDDFDVGLGEV
jgi:hypothetical protein